MLKMSSRARVKVLVFKPFRVIINGLSLTFKSFLLNRSYIAVCTVKLK